MALFDDASLVVTPNGYKAGTLYSIKPTSGAGDMTVLRATTATRVNSAGLIESVANNVPRLDYSNGTCPSLLVEPQRSNLLRYSEQFDNAAWTNVGTVTANTTISPDGTQNADTVTSIIFQQSFGTNVFTFSCYAKVNGGDGLFYIRVDIPATNQASFNLNNGTILSTPAGYTTSIENVGNGWYRCTMTTPSVNVINAVLVSANYGASPTYLWGAQLEVGSYPTSYIPTTSAAVTRNADVISKTGISSLIGQTEGTVFLDYIWNNNQIDVIPIEISGNNGKFIWFRANGVQFYGNGSSLVFNYDPNDGVYGNRYKLAFVYGQSDFRVYVNGTLVDSQASGTFSGTFDSILSDPIGASPYNGSTKHNIITLFPTKLTNAELASLTTI